jgi:cysteine desulfurase
MGGGAQERGRRAGTEALPALAGFGAAAEEVPARLAATAGQERNRDRVRAALLELGAQRIGPDDGLPNTICARFPGVAGELLVSALDLEGIAISTGAACSSGLQKPSKALLALGLAPEQCLEAIRISLGPDTTEAEVKGLLDELPPILDRLRRFSAP